MFRYIGLVWDNSDPTVNHVLQIIRERILALSPTWQTTLDEDGICVFCAGTTAEASRSQSLSGSRGVVLGTVFRRRDVALHEPRRLLQFEDKESDTIISTGGRHLIGAYWGRYVAFLVDPRSSKRWILKDPTGDLPCFETMFRGVHLYFSCIADCLALRVMQFTVDWPYVRRRVATGWLCADSTGLTGVIEVYRGQCVEIDRQRVSRRFYWNPATFADSHEEETGAVATVLRDTAKACMPGRLALSPSSIDCPEGWTHRSS